MNLRTSVTFFLEFRKCNLEKVDDTSSLSSVVFGVLMLDVHIVGQHIKIKKLLKNRF